MNFCIREIIGRGSKMRKFLVISEKYYNRDNDLFSLENAFHVFLCTEKKTLSFCSSSNEQQVLSDGKYFIIQHGAKSDEIDYFLSLNEDVGFSRNCVEDRHHIIPGFKFIVIRNKVVANNDTDCEFNSYDVKLGLIEQSHVSETAVSYYLNYDIDTDIAELTYKHCAIHNQAKEYTACIEYDRTRQGFYYGGFYYYLKYNYDGEDEDDGEYEDDGEDGEDGEDEDYGEDEEYDEYFGIDDMGYVGEVSISSVRFSG